MRLINYIDIWYETQNALLFFKSELLGGNFLGRVTHRDCSLNCQNPEFDIGQCFLLPSFDGYRRSPVRKSLGSDADLIRGSWLGLLECKRSILLRYSSKAIAGSLLKDDG